MEKVYISSTELLEKSQILYEFVDRFSNYENTARNYCNGYEDLFSMTEVHILAMINDNPGISASQLAVLSRRSKSFISQIVSKFRNLDYIVQVAEESDLKKKHLFVSAKGKELCDAHSKFDEIQLMKTYKYLLRDCTSEEIEAFYKVMSVYNAIMKAAERKRKGQS